MKPLSEQTLYELLEVPVDAPESQIVEAWERMQAVYGGESLATYTLVAPDEAALLGARLREARVVLLDPVARHDYDARISRSTPQPMPLRLAPSATPVPASSARETPLQLHLGQPAPAAQADGPIVLRQVVAAPVEAPQPAPAAPGAAPAAAPARPRRGGVERELFIPEGTRYTGEVLRRAREARALTVEQLCARIKITRQHLENLEADRYERLPAAVYLRGILMTLAKELRLDGQKVARSYLEAVAEAAATRQR